MHNKTSVERNRNREGSVHARASLLTWGYTFTMSSCATLSLIAVIVIPFIYDQLNAQRFAANVHNLWPREYRDSILSQELSARSSTSAPVNYGDDVIAAVKSKQLISHDYILQLERVTQIRVANFILFGSVVAVLFFLCCSLILHLSARSILRGAALFLAFFIALLLLQVFGLPHTNQKFHVIFGFLYAVLISLSDFLNTVDLDLPDAPADGDGDGYLSSLQYKHRFWMVVFNFVVATIISLAITTSFRLLDTFLVIFGEGFVTFPLVGLFSASIIAILWIAGGMLRPIRRHLKEIETAMARQPIADNQAATAPAEAV